ncbi:MarR family winged helix-turn-helix transcriptional regulator [Paraburkholderia sp. MM5477-R1]|uniref:MarR family winged helix-turn-helix transcriptional regulator n=1 Tax=Paraburkholderia sp. MM5477-R1 TaxID=2991062 RepID=UPI003D1EC1B0
MAKIKKKEAEFLDQVLGGLSAPFHLSYRFVALGELVTNANDTIFQQQIGLGLKELRILRIAFQFPGQPVSVIARWTFSEKAMMSKLVSRLCNLGYLERRIDDADARSTQLFVTESGAALVKTADALSNDLFRRQFPTLSRDACVSLMNTLDDVLRDFVAAQLTPVTDRPKLPRSKGRRAAG